MMPNILGTEVNECVANRQNSKIQFLQAENAQLQEDIKDLEQALRLNKEALKISYEQRNRFQSSNQSNHSTTIGQSSLAIESEAQSKLFEKLYAENKQLFDSLQRVTRERNQAQTKVLIQEQVNEEAVAFQKDIIQELEEKILELRRIIHDKEYAIQELEKMKPIQNKDIAIKIREIITPNEQSLKMHSEIENHKYMVKKLSLENQKLKQCNQKIKAFNRVLKRDVIKIKVALKNPLNYNKMKEFIFNDRLEHGDEDLLINKEFIKEFYMEKDEWIEQQNLHQQQQLYNRNYYQNPNIKSKSQLIEDLSRLQMTVRNFKIIFHRETQSNSLLLKQIDELQAFNTQVCETNQTLIDSQKPMQERIDKMKQEVDYYKQYYQKYMDKIRNRRRNNSSVTLDAPPLTQPPQTKFFPSRHAPSQSMPQNFMPSSPRLNNPMITEAMEHEEMTARGGGIGKTDRRDFYTPLTPTGSNNNFQPLVSPSYAQQQQQRVLFFMQQKNNVPTGGDMTSINAVSAIGNINNVSNNMNQAAGAAQQQDYDFGFAYPNTARPFTNSNLNNSNNNIQPQNGYNNMQEFANNNDQDSSFDDGELQEEMTINQCKAFLINLAKDLYENSNIKANQKQFGLTKQLKDRWQQQQQLNNNNNTNNRINVNCITRAKRSLSDPLVYIFQEDLKLKQQLEEEQQRKQESDHLRLFSVDMSIIGSSTTAFPTPSLQGIRSGKPRRNSKLITNTLGNKKAGGSQQSQQSQQQSYPVVANVNVLDPNASFISTDNDLNF